jgi:DNA-binding XRE family transcriptional regulator
MRVKYGRRYDKVMPMAEAMKIPIENESLVLSYMDRAGKIAISRLADGFGMSKTQLAETAGLARETLYRVERSGAPKTQGRLREMLEIISRVTEWAGGKEQAMAWYRAQPLPAFGGRTAESLVKEGKAAAVRDYLDHMALGGFA